jgi:hypothetical protein
MVQRIAVRLLHPRNRAGGNARVILMAAGVVASRARPIVRAAEQRSRLRSHPTLRQRVRIRDISRSVIRSYLNERITISAFRRRPIITTPDGGSTIPYRRGGAGSEAPDGRRSSLWVLAAAGTDWPPVGSSSGIVEVSERRSAADGRRHCYSSSFHHAAAVRRGARRPQRPPPRQFPQAFTIWRFITVGMYVIRAENGPRSRFGLG